MEAKGRKTRQNPSYKLVSFSRLFGRPRRFYTARASNTLGPTDWPVFGSTSVPNERMGQNTAHNRC